MSNIPSLKSMLKLYTKKELWGRIQHHIRTIDNLRQQLNQQKEMWNELKEWIAKDHNWNLEQGNNDCALGQRWVLYKIEELELREKDEQD